MAFFLFSLSAQLQAAAYCAGTLNKTLTWPDGRVAIESTWRSDWATICNLNAPWKGVPAQTCWAWYATTTTAVTEQKSVVVFYPSLNWDQCPTMPTYDDAPAPGYLLIDGDP